MYDDRVIANCDGGARGNPGPAAIGIVLRDKELNILEEYSEYIGDYKKTNNEAECELHVYKNAKFIFTFE